MFLFVDDPNRVVVDVELQAKDGRRIDRDQMRSGASPLRGLLLDALPPVDARLLVRISSPAAVRTHPFKLENIPLP